MGTSGSLRTDININDGIQYVFCYRPPGTMPYVSSRKLRPDLEFVLQDPLIAPGFSKHESFAMMPGPFYLGAHRERPVITM